MGKQIKLSLEKVKYLAQNCTDCVLMNRVRATPLISDANEKEQPFILIVGPNFGPDASETIQKIERYLGEGWFDSKFFDYVQALKCSGVGYVNVETCGLQTQNYAFTRSYSGFLVIGRHAHQQFDSTMKINTIKKTNSGTPILILPDAPELIDNSVLLEFLVEILGESFLKPSSELDLQGLEEPRLRRSNADADSKDFEEQLVLQQFGLGASFDG